MSFDSVSGKNWIFKKFNDNDIKEFTENYSLNEIVAKLLSIRKKHIENIDLFLNPLVILNFNFFRLSIKFLVIGVRSRIISNASKPANWSIASVSSTNG